MIQFLAFWIFIKGFSVVAMILLCSMLGGVNWFTFWVLFELLGWMFLSLLSKEEDSFFTSSALWKFFFYQFLSSSIFLLGFIFSSNQSFDSNLIRILFFVSMIMKLGVPPCHGWLVQVSENIPFNSFFFLNFFSKLGPVMVFSHFLDYDFFFFFAVILLCIGSAGGWNLFSTHRFLVYSSAMNMGWALSCLLSSKCLFIGYFLTYSVAFWFFFLLVESMGESKINVPSHYPSNIFTKLLFLFSIMGIMGVPPMSLFFFKYFSVKLLVSNGQILLSTLLVVFTAAFMYMYLCAFSTQIFSKTDILKKHSNKAVAFWFFFLLVGLIYYFVIF